MLNIEEIKEREQAAMSVLARAELSYDAEYRPLLESVSDIPRMISEVEQLRKFCDDWCSGEDQYQETVSQLDCARSALAAKDQQIATLTKALELACERRGEMFGLPKETVENNLQSEINFFIQQAQEGQK